MIVPYPGTTGGGEVPLQQGRGSAPTWRLRTSPGGLADRRRSGLAELSLPEAASVSRAELAGCGKRQRRSRTKVPGVGNPPMRRNSMAGRPRTYKYRLSQGDKGGSGETEKKKKSSLGSRKTSFAAPAPTRTGNTRPSPKAHCARTHAQWDTSVLQGQEGTYGYAAAAS